MQAEPHFSWLQGFVIPVLFTFFGAALGFVASQIRDDRNAKRPKRSFMRAIGMELDALGVQLEGSLREVKESTQRINSGGTGAHFAGNLRTSVFNGQIGKLRDVDDAMVIEIIHFYSDLSTIKQIFEAVNDADTEYNRTTSDVNKTAARSRLLSALMVLQGQISGFGERLKKLRIRLTLTETPEN